MSVKVRNYISNASVTSTTTTGSVTLIADDGYRIVECTGTTRDAFNTELVTYTPTYNADNTIAYFINIDITTDDPTSFRLDGTTEQIPVITTTTLTNNVANSVSDTSELTYGISKTVTVTTNENYTFTDCYIQYILNSVTHTIDATFSSDNKTATFTFTCENNSDNWTIEGGTSRDPDIIKDTFLTTIINPSDSEVNRISSKRFIIREHKSSEVTNPYEEAVVDLGEYISAFNRFYLSEVDYNSNGVVPISLGGYDLEMKCKNVPNHIITKYMGSITIPQIYGNKLDIEETKAILYLPFYGFIDIDLSIYYNHNINITYYIDLASGDFTAILSLYKSTHLIESYNGNMAFTVPYKVGDNFTNTKFNTLNNELESTEYLTPIIRIYYPREYYKNISFNLNSFSQLKNWTPSAHTELLQANISKLPNNVIISDEEYQLLETTLNNGFYF